jgi:hypothetical protein
MSSIRSLLAAALVLAAGAARAEEQVYLFQTQESDAVTTDCAVEENIVLGAYVYAPRTRANDAKVVREFGQAVGKVVGCGTMPKNVWFGSKAPFSMDFDLEGRRIYAAGECTVQEIFFPIKNDPRPVLLVGCSLTVTPPPEVTDPVERAAQKASLRGIATSSSVFMMAPIAGYSTGSYWTLHLYTND